MAAEPINMHEVVEGAAAALEAYRMCKREVIQVLVVMVQMVGTVGVLLTGME